MLTTENDMVLLWDIEAAEFKFRKDFLVDSEYSGSGVLHSEFVVEVAITTFNGSIPIERYRQFTIAVRTEV